MITALFLTVIYNSFYIAGLTGRVLFPDADPDHLTVIMAINLLPKAMAALMMIGIFAAMISTATSILLVVGQAIGRDFYAKTINKEATPEKEVFVTRVAVTVVALACMLFNYTNPPHFLSISFILDSVASAPASACRFSLGLSVTAVRKRARLLLPSWVPPHIWYSHMPWALISGFPACWPYWSRHS